MWKCFASLVSSCFSAAVFVYHWTWVVAFTNSLKKTADWNRFHYLEWNIEQLASWLVFLASCKGNCTECGACIPAGWHKWRSVAAASAERGAGGATGTGGVSLCCDEGWGLLHSASLYSLRARTRLQSLLCCHSPHPSVSERIQRTASELPLWKFTNSNRNLSDRSVICDS